MPVPVFSLTRPRYDQSTFIGRTQHFYEVTDARTLLTTDAQLAAAKVLLDRYRDGTLPTGTTDEQLWRARRLREACVHPDTGETISPLFRFSCFAPANMFIIPAMLLPSTIASVWRTVSSHWLNQSYNATVNYANRNASTPVASETLAKAYAGAVSASVGIALVATALSRRVERLGRPALSTLVRATLPYAAVATAGCLNLALVRQSELVDGVELTDSEGRSHGKSVIAGRTAIAKCCAARCLWNFPVLVREPPSLSSVAPRAMGESIVTQAIGCVVDARRCCLHC
jgi:tricarboxylate carrier